MKKSIDFLCLSWGKNELRVDLSHDIYSMNEERARKKGSYFWVGPDLGVQSVCFDLSDSLMLQKNGSVECIPPPTHSHCLVLRHLSISLVDMQRRFQSFSHLRDLFQHHPSTILEEGMMNFLFFTTCLQHSRDQGKISSKTQDEGPEAVSKASKQTTKATQP